MVQQFICEEQIEIVSKKLENSLSKLKERSEIINATLFNEDGFVIASSDKLKQGDPDYDFYQNLAAISSEIMSMATNLVQMSSPSSIASNVNLQGGTEREQDSFVLLLMAISDEVQLVTVYPANANVGLINFEINQIISELNQYCKIE